MLASLSGLLTGSYLRSRRGRGRSGDAAAYSLDKELEDIEAVLRACDRTAHVLGHSYGAVCALETARRSSIGKLALYEPPLPIDGSTVGPAFATFRHAVAAGRLDEALATMLRDIVHVSDDQLFSLQRSPLWDQMAALTPSAKRELEVIAGLERGVDRFRAMSAPTLLFLGTETAPHHKTAVRALQQALPNARTAFLPGQGHEAHVHAPDLVAREIAEFLRAT
jgi:pimeloyl-ACP methyl ester carboxylesterase